MMQHFNFYIVIIIIALGLWAMISKRNLIKKCIGMAIFQTGIILFFISMGAKKGATIPIIKHAYTAVHHPVIASDYDNPLTQILMLTAIVVGVATLGVALSLVQSVYANKGTIEEDKLAND